MWKASYPIFEWAGQTWTGKAISDSIYAFPVIETIHILAMAVMFGALLAMNIKLLGVGFRNQPIKLLSKTLMPFVNWGLIVMLISGYLMFTSEAIKDFTNDGFYFKMIALFWAIVFQVALYTPVVKKDGPTGVLGAVYAIVCFVLWFCVGAGGRAIGFV